MREMILGERTRNSIYKTAYVVYLAELILFNSVYGKMDQLQRIFALVRVTAYFLVCCKLLLDFLARKFSLKEIGTVGLISMFLLWTTLNTGNKAILIYWAFIVGAHDVEFKKLIKWSCAVHVLCLLFIIGSSYGGLVENRVYDGTDRKRESLGFQFTTESSNYFLYTILMWMYVRKERITWKELAGLGAFAGFLFMKTDTKSAFTFSCVALVCAALLKKSRWLREYHKSYIIGAVGSVPLLAYGIYQLSVRFTTRAGWMRDLNELLSGRLRLGKQGYRQYGVPLWGQRIEWVGGTAGYEGLDKVYNYVDSSFMQTLLNLGLAFLIFLLVLLVLLGLKTAIKKDTYLLAAMIIFAMHSTFDPQLIWMEFNTFVMLYSYFYWKGEPSPYLKRLKGDLLRHKALAGVCMVCFVLAFVYMGSQKETELEAREARYQAAAENYEDNLLKYDDQIQDIRQSIAMAKEQEDKLKDYIDHSLYMKLDGEDVYVTSVRYQLSTERSAGNILNSMSFYINEGGLLEDMKIDNPDLDMQYWRDMISCSTSEDALRITVRHFDEQEGQKILAAARQAFEGHWTVIRAVQGDFTMTETENPAERRKDGEVTKNQDNYKATLESYEKSRADLEERLAKTQENKDAYMESRQPEAPAPVRGRSVLAVQYGAVGMVTGLMLVCVFFMMCYLFFDREPKRGYTPQMPR